MERISRYFQYPKTKDIIEDSKEFSVNIEYDGTIESFKRAIEETKSSVELKARDELANINIILNYVLENFREYLISEVKSVVFVRFGFNLLKIENKSKEYSEQSRSLKIETGDTLVSEIKNYKNSTSYHFDKILIFGLALFLFMRYK
jgi:hypothetical protein